MTDRLRGAAVWRLTAVLMASVLVVPLAACGVRDEAGQKQTPDAGRAAETTDLVLASTTSTQDSGLLDVLVPAFEEAHPEYRVNVIATGSGEALELGKNKDADVLLVHAKDAEERFVADGYGIERRDVMYNDFVIVGPAADPAGIKGVATAAEALAALSASGASFVSRGDGSGTHVAEKSLWARAGVTPAGDWYVSAGRGMGDVLTMASELGAYTLTDRATFLSMHDALALEVVVEGDSALFNQYGVIPVTDATNLDGALAFADWVVSEEAQEIIAEYGVEEYGQPLFFPNAE